MSDDQQLERIFNKLDELAKGHSAMTERLARIETHWETHIKESTPLREMLGRHEQSLQRFRGVAWLLSILWGALLTALGIKYGVK